MIEYKKDFNLGDVIEFRNRLGIVRKMEVSGLIRDPAVCLRNIEDYSDHETEVISSPLFQDRYVKNLGKIRHEDESYDQMKRYMSQDYIETIIDVMKKEGLKSISHSISENGYEVSIKIEKELEEK